MISLISVFLALAIGILLGVAVADRGVVSSGLEAQITDVQRRLELQQEDIGSRDRQIARLRERTRQDEDIMSGMSEALISDQLAGAEVAVVSGPYADGAAVDGVLNALDLSGATVTSTRPLDEPGLEEVTTSAETTTLLQSDYTSVAETVLQDAGDATTPPQVVIFVGGGRVPADSPEETLDALNEALADMFDVWEGAGLRVVGAESSQNTRSDVELFQSASLTSVDNADTVAGQAALVQAILSGEDGSYGTKPTSSDLFPPPPN